MPDTEREEFLRETAMKTLQTIWDWDYFRWETVEDLVTGPLAAMLRNAMGDEASPVERTLSSLTISDIAFEDDELARVCADYVLQDNGEAERSERIVWIFLLEDGVWKAASVTR